MTGMCYYGTTRLVSDVLYTLTYQITDNIEGANK